MTDFEIECSKEEENYPNTGEINENVIEWLKGNDKVTVTFSQRKYITKMRRLAEKYPDEVEIVVDEDTHIVAHFPLKWLKISNRKRNISDEERAKLTERMKKARAKRFGTNDEDYNDVDIDEDFDEDIEEED